MTISEETFNQIYLKNQPGSDSGLGSVSNLKLWLTKAPCDKKFHN